MSSLSAYLGDGVCRVGMLWRAELEMVDDRCECAKRDSYAVDRLSAASDAKGGCFEPFFVIQNPKSRKMKFHNMIFI